METTKNITFNDLPQAIKILTQAVSELKTLLLKRNDNPCAEKQEKLLSVKEAAKFLNLSVPTIYTKVSKDELPVMKQGNRLYFSDSELMAYLKKGRKLTNSEIEDKASNYLMKNSQD